jgi:Sensors of blue-light using FAD
MLSLTYVSSATRLFSQQELIQLLTESRARNAHWDISGMML